jgi:hypothetical protein
VTWTLSGVGTLSGTTYTAPDRAGSATITADAGCGCGKWTKTFSIIEPSGAQFTKSGGDKHINGWTSAGFLANVTILPTSVSFYAIQIKEDSVAPTGTSGDWAGIGNHAEGSWISVNADNTLPAQDHINSKGGPGAVPGGYTWAIPWRYHVGSGTGYIFSTQNHVFSADNAGTATQSKAGVSTAAIPLNAASTDWPF